jgi:hypothetical protein
MRVSLCKGRFPYSCVLLRFLEHPWAHALELLQEPRQQRFFVGISNDHDELMAGGVRGEGPRAKC